MSATYRVRRDEAQLLFDLRLPRVVRDGLLERAQVDTLIRRRVPDRQDCFSRRYVLTPTSDGYVLDAAVIPVRSEAQIARMGNRLRMKYAQRVGFYHYSELVGSLHVMNGIIAQEVLGIRARVANSMACQPVFQPYGEWEFIPPDHGYDYRARARRSVPRGTLPPHQLLACLAEPAVSLALTITYQPLTQKP